MCSSAIQNSLGIAEVAELRAEFLSVVANCGFFELGSRFKVSLSGKDRERWLNGMITNKIRDLAAGRGLYAFVLNAQGHILGDLYVYNRGEALLVDTDGSQSEKLLGVFRKYIIMDKVEIADLSATLTAIGVAGPKAGESLRAAGFDFADLESLQFVDLSWRDQPMSIVRHDNSAIDSYEIWLAPEHVPGVRDALASSGATPISENAVELLRIASGIPRYGQDIRERDLPQETEQMRALNFTKGCYIGQEIVERIRSRGNVHRTFTGFEVQGTLPAPGSKIQSEGKEVGEITSVASLPLSSGERPVALGYIRREYAGKLIHAGDAQLRTSQLPFAGIFQNR